MTVDLPDSIEDAWTQRKQCVDEVVQAEQTVTYQRTVIDDRMRRIAFLNGWLAANGESIDDA